MTQRLDSGGTQSIGSPDEREAQDVAEYVERQREIETRLSKLETELEHASGDSHSGNTELVHGLRSVVKDVRCCLQRCELLIQLPQIREFVKQFQRSVEANGVLHQRWLGPDPGVDPFMHRARGQEVIGVVRGERTDLLKTKRSNSATPQRGSGSGTGKKSESKRKPFRTVVDWGRPHTPLSLDPSPSPGLRPVGEPRPPEGPSPAFVPRNIR